MKKTAAIAAALSALIIALWCTPVIPFPDYYEDPARAAERERFIEEYKDYTPLLSDVRERLLALNAYVTVYRDSDGGSIGFIGRTDEHTSVVLREDDYLYKQITQDGILMSEIEKILALPHMRSIYCSYSQVDECYIVSYDTDGFDSWGGHICSIEYGYVNYGEQTLINDNWYYTRVQGE